MSDSIASTCCGFVVQLVVAACCTTNCTTNPLQIESQQQVHNRSPQQVLRQTATWSYNKSDNLSHSKSTTSCMQQSASLTASRTTCRTTNPQLIEVMESDIKQSTTVYAQRCVRDEAAGLWQRRLLRVAGPNEKAQVLLDHGRTSTTYGPTQRGCPYTTVAQYIGFSE